MKFKEIIAIFASAVSGYLIGSISFATVVSILYAKKDIRTLGSGNAGTTNVLRNFGLVPAALTAAGDLGKGMIAALIGQLICRNLGPGGLAGICAAGFGAVLGHILPLYFGFRGGKSVLVTAGVVFINDETTLGILLAIFLIIVLSTKYVSLSSISAAFMYPVVTFASRMISGQDFILETAFAAAAGGMIIYVHRENIKRLFDGSESKIKIGGMSKS